MSRGSPEATLREAGHDPGLFLGGRNATAVTAYETLKAALADQATWTQRAAGAKELLAAMLGSRRQAAKLALEYDIRCAPHAPGPPRASQRQEALLSGFLLLSSSYVWGFAAISLRFSPRYRCACARSCWVRGVSGVGDFSL